MKAFLIPILLTAATYTCSATDTRIRNESTADFKDVIFGGKKYGDIKQGATTEYQQNVRAFRDPTGSLKADGKVFKNLRIDNVGEEVLGEGKFTYVITINSGRLIIRAEKDTDTK